MNEEESVTVSHTSEGSPTGKVLLYSLDGGKTWHEHPMNEEWERQRGEG